MNCHSEEQKAKGAAETLTSRLWHDQHDPKYEYYFTLLHVSNDALIYMWS